MVKEKDCSRCYVEIKHYHPIIGTILIVFVTIILMIPILNIYICQCFFKDGRKRKGDKGYMEDFWDSCFYNYVKVEVRK